MSPSVDGHRCIDSNKSNRLESLLSSRAAAVTARPMSGACRYNRRRPNFRATASIASIATSFLLVRPWWTFQLVRLSSQYEWPLPPTQRRRLVLVSRYVTHNFLTCIYTPPSFSSLYDVGTTTTTPARGILFTAVTTKDTAQRKFLSTPTCVGPRIVVAVLNCTSQYLQFPLSVAM